MSVDLLSDKSCHRRVAPVKKALDHVSQYHTNMEPPDTPKWEGVWVELVTDTINKIATPSELELFPNGVEPYVRAIVSTRIYG